MDLVVSMKKNRVFSLILCLLMLVSCLVPALAEDTAPEEEAFSVRAKAAMLIDLQTGRVVYEQDADERVYPASLTKIMTCLLALENGNLSDIVTVGDNAYYGLDPDSSTAGLIVGEKMTLENMLYCMMVCSGNEACNVVAAHIAGSVDDFVRMMNERAYQLGCTGTQFKNPHGLHDPEHFTTARDLSLIAQAALKSENFKVIVDTPEYTLPATNLSPERTIKTTNQLIARNSNNPFYYSKASGIKTGYTSAAGRCVISMAEDDDLSFLAIVCGAATSIQENGDLLMESFPQCIRLFDYGFDNFSYVTILSPLYPVAQIAVNNSAGSESVALAPARDIRLLLPVGYDEALVRTEVSLKADSVDAPVQSGARLGRVRVYYDGELLGETELAAIADVAKSDIAAVNAATGAYIQQNWWKWIVIAIVGLLAAVVVFWILRMIRREQRRRRKIAERRRALEERLHSWNDEV